MVIRLHSMDERSEIRPIRLVFEALNTEPPLFGFVEAEDRETGRSINLGQWSADQDGAYLEFDAVIVKPVPADTEVTRG